ncbi:MAG TPA: NAD(P)-dependent oxidoreductase [Propionibacteriaceae bacterium]|nr:NAD(P)-dependent oxidoreductase [Propionibacteriaceae bacterium]
MRVLVADKFEQSGLDGLAAAGCEVDFQPSLADQALVDAVASTSPDVLVVRSTKVPEAVLSAGPLTLVVRAGAGYNTIDVAAASRLGIYVSNCPGKNSVAVAELAMGLICALDRRIPDQVAALREGRWDKGTFSKGAPGLYGRTLGLLGLGQIGRALAARAKGFGMKVVAWSRSLTPELAEELGVEYAATPLDVATVADVVSLHVAYKPDTKGLVNAEFLAAMKPGAMVINTSRGEVVDEAALAEAVTSKGIRVGLDVYDGEPSGASGDFAPAIVGLPGVYGTHHVGASTDQAQEAIAAEAVRIVKEFKQTGKVPNVVNLAAKSDATHSLIVRHIDRPGILAATLAAVREAGINVQEMENVVFEGSEAAVARINLSEPLADDVVAALGNLDGVLDVSLVAL